MNYLISKKLCGMLEQKFYSIMIMEDKKKCNSEDLIDENLDIANQTLEVLKNQEKQIIKTGY